MVRICLVEDEVKVAAFIKKGLEENSYKVDVANEAKKAMELLGSKSYDLMILDIILPGQYGTAFCKELREDNNHIPILMLTALGTIDDKITGLKAGADDYLVKPFRFEELLARIEAMIRRQQIYKQEQHILSYEGIELNIWEKTVKREGKKMTLTAKEYSLLEFFLKNPEKLLTRQFIAEKVWGIDFDTGTNVIDVYVNYLRNKVDKEFDLKLIHTVVGMGYILKKGP